MFERFTDRAMRVVVLARDEARQLRHDRVGTEHLLLGLLGQGDSLAANVLDSIGITDAAVREHVKAADDQGERVAGVMPFTAQARRALELSFREALEHGASYIAPEHILLGVMRAADSEGGRVLADLGADLDAVRRRVSELGGVAGQQDSELIRLRREMEAALQRADFKAAAAHLESQRRLVAELLVRARARQAGPTLADQVRDLRREVERLRGIMREHGIDAGQADEA
jgi:ATP-dependent Clp protease ATP-binding subunit ClpA